MKRPHRHLVLAFLVILAPIAASARVPQKCPTVWVGSPTTGVTPGKSVVFTARLTGLNPTVQPEFHWEVSAGGIISGQGTPQLTVDTAGLGGQVVTARVSIGGVSRPCSVEASHSYPIPFEPITCGLPFDQYGDISLEYEQARLDSFVIQLFNETRSQGYIFAYAGRRSYKGEAAARLRRAKDYLVEVRQMSPGRIVTIDGGYKEDFEVTLIIVPLGATPPSAMPTLSPSEVQLTKPQPRSPLKSHRYSRNK